MRFNYKDYINWIVEINLGMYIEIKRFDHHNVNIKKSGTSGTSFNV